MNIWTNPNGLNAAARATTSGASGVKKYGDGMWEYITFHYEGFRKGGITAFLQSEYGLTKSTAEHYASAFIAYCFAAKEDFVGPGSVIQKRGFGYRLIDSERTE